MKGERNAQVYQVGPHLFGTSSTIPHWKTGKSPTRAFASPLPSCSNLKEVRELNNRDSEISCCPYSGVLSEMLAGQGGSGSLF